MSLLQVHERMFLPEPLKLPAVKSSLVFIFLFLELLFWFIHSSIFRGEKGFLWLTLSGDSPSLRDVRGGTQADACIRNHGQMLLTGSLTSLCIASFLKQGINICLRIVPPTVGLALLSSINFEDNLPYICLQTDVI